MNKVQCTQEQRTYATICVYHRDLTISEMIAVLKIVPARISEKNLRINNISSGCYYCSRGEIDSTDLRDHMAFLILKYNDILKKSCKNNRYGFKSTISIFCESNPGESSSVVSSKHMKFFARLGLELYFDYWYW